MTSTDRPPTGDEALKRNSRFLRGTIARGLSDAATGGIGADDAKLLKFHGTYLQDDRDVRVERMEQKLEPDYQFMVRVRMPGGVCTPAQWYALDGIARTYGNASLRITTRQTFQFHGVAKRNLRATIAGINDALLSTIAACGDVNRNVVCHNNPYLSPVHADVYRTACELSAHLVPGTRAYHEIWLGGHKVAGSQSDDEEPFYGAAYLPRKFKIGIALPPYNDIDVFSQDLGFIAIVEAGRIAGYDVCVGGGMGMSHSDPDTYARLADVIGFCLPAEVVGVAEAIVGIQRDFGDRSNRKHARFKYTIDDRGIEWLTAALARRRGTPLAAARDFGFEHNRDPHGWHQGDDGRHHVLINVLSGRIRDDLLEALREIAALDLGEFRLTNNQNVMVANVPHDSRGRIEAILERYGIDPNAGLAPVRRDALSCVALPTCGLAMAESERMLPSLVARLDALLVSVGLESLPLTVRVSGCPNGCSRPYLAEVALVGRSLGRYDLYVGANATGARMSRRYRTNLGEDEIFGVLRPMFARYLSERHHAERFGDFVLRTGYVAPLDDPRDYNRD